MADRSNRLFIFGSTIFFVWFIIIVYSLKCWCYDRGILWSRFYIFVEPEYFRISLVYLLDHACYFTQLYLWKIYAFYAFIVIIFLQDNRINKFVDYNRHLSSINIIRKLANVSNVSNYVPQCLEIDCIIQGSLGLFLLQIDITLIILQVKRTFDNFFETYYRFKELSRMEVIFDIPSIWFKLRQIIQYRMHVC